MYCLRPSQAGGCFIAGTPVWTDRGLVPIEQLKVGDNVLSQPEETGERAYRKVVRTFSYENKTIVSVRYSLAPPDDTESYFQYATGNHPLWVKGVGWTRADLLEGGEELELQDGRSAYVLEVVPVHETGEPGIGWEPEYLHSEDGFKADFSDGWKWVADGVGGDKNRPHLQTKVYNIEVDGFHTYYVGEAGVWVHNANCASIDLMTPGNGVPPDPNMPRCESEVDVNAAMPRGFSRADRSPRRLVAGLRISAAHGGTPRQENPCRVRTICPAARG
ncbi:polymorphic toxin-type HINT domain-containing protein [Luteibacter sp. PPL552]